MKRTLLQLTIAIFAISVLISASSPEKKQVNKFIKKEMAASPNARIKEIVVYQIINGTTVASAFANFAFSQFTTKSAMDEDSTNYIKTEFEYFDDHNNQVTSQWIDGEWVANFRTIMYEQVGRASYDTMISQMFDSTLMDFMNLWKWTNQFDANGNDTTEIGWMYNQGTNSWELSDKTVKTFDANNRVTLEVRYAWSYLISALQQSQKTLYTYNGDDIAQSETFLYNEATSQWLPNQKDVHDRNEAKNYYSIIDSIYDFSIAGFKPSSLEVYSGQDFDIDTAVTFDWSDTLSNWAPRYMYANNTSTEGVSISTDWFYPILSSQNSATTDLTIYQKGFASVIIWEGNNTLAKVIPENSISVFPNPVQHEVTIQIQNPVNCRLAVFNVTGKLMLTKEIINTTSKISMENVDNGIYFFKINNNGNLTTQKVIKY